jgi:hypothetical protein
MELPLHPIEPPLHLPNLARVRQLFDEQNDDEGNEDENKNAGHDMPPARSIAISGVMWGTIAKPRNFS